MHRTTVTLIATAVLLTVAAGASAHCQIPCGIYGDSMRFLTMEEHVATLEKSVNMITKLENASKAGDLNQLVRWVENKEVHADAVAEIATEYFLRQRIKAPEAGDKAARERYLRQLEILHDILVTSMKVKQSTDMSQVKRLGRLVVDLAEAYLSKEDLEHLNAHGG